MSTGRVTWPSVIYQRAVIGVRWRPTECNQTHRSQFCSALSLNQHTPQYYSEQLLLTDSGHGRDRNTSHGMATRVRDMFKTDYMGAVSSFHFAGPKIA